MMVVMLSCCKVLEVLGVLVCMLGGEEVKKLKKFKFRLQVVLDMRENELEQRQMEAAKIIAALRKQEAELQEIIDSQYQNSEQMEALYDLGTLDIQQIEAHRDYGLKLIVDAQNKERIISNTKILLERKQKEVREVKNDKIFSTPLVEVEHVLQEFRVDMVNDLRTLHALPKI